ncbi:hypothetical protein P261_02651 [Lachnospiraceae bacterium TWA4]|nr:hypothetical protein P261_02651 [Lachnospiraceae bacterium TWA4]
MKLLKKRNIDWIFLIIGLLLLSMEIAKQYYLFFVYFDRHYNVWYFPFQLCSIPMYLCIVRFFLNERNYMKKECIDTFLQDFTLLGGIGALAVPDGFIYPNHMFLTLHGYLWHVILILISVLMFYYRLADSSMRGFLKSLVVFLPSTVLAEVINVVLHPFGDCDMFYISPYHLSTQPILHWIDGQIGRTLGILFYVILMFLEHI